MCATRGKAARCVHAESSSCCTHFSSASVPFQKGMHDDGWGIGTTSIQRCFAGPFFLRSSHFQFQRTFPGSSERWMMHAMMQLSAGFFRRLDRCGRKSVSQKEALGEHGELLDCTTDGTRGFPPIETRQDGVGGGRERLRNRNLCCRSEPGTRSKFRTRALNVNRRKLDCLLELQTATACTFICSRKKGEVLPPTEIRPRMFFLHFLLQITKFLTQQNLKQCISRRAMYL